MLACGDQIRPVCMMASSVKQESRGFSHVRFNKQKIDADAKSNIRIISSMDDDRKNHILENGYIDFKSKDGNQKTLFYSHFNQIDESNYDYYCERGLEEIVSTETTDISLRYDDESVSIIKSIVTGFGGWIDESDCDDEEYYPIIKNEDGTIKPVFRVTMNDIYEKFGGVVIIDKTK